MCKVKGQKDVERGEEILFFVVTVITEKFLRFGDIEMNIPGAWVRTKPVREPFLRTREKKKGFEWKEGKGVGDGGREKLGEK